MAKKYNEDSRVKIPAILHFKRLGYDYLSIKNANIDRENNIFIDVFTEAISEINDKKFSKDEIRKLIDEIGKLTSNHDKGKEFFERLIKKTGVKLIDVVNFDKNLFHIVTELPFKNKDENFRPDITVLINGIPVAFLEVKVPNNKDGVQAEFRRMNERMSEPLFERFMNQMQIVGLSNNLEYDDTEKTKRSGSFYMSPNGAGKSSMNHFREEQEIHVGEYVDEQFIQDVLTDTRYHGIEDTPEFKSNMKVESPTNRFITSMFSKERIGFILRYGIVYVDSSVDGLQKHIIRYPQIFALMQIVEDIKGGMTKGIIWHTQGSGKTALSYFATNVLRDYYSEKGVVTMFYFVVDRLDLLIQASTEFGDRGLSIKKIRNREAFIERMKSVNAAQGSAQRGKYKDTMNVVNIHKFTEKSKVDDGVIHNIQRIYFLDEVHRSYKPSGKFLANLLGADKNGIFIGLTGTPILKDGKKSTGLFGKYIHSYYYNKSIADGYTLPIKKENIGTEFRDGIRKLFEIGNGERIPSKLWEKVTLEKPFIDSFCDYVEDDFENFRDVRKDDTLGGMIVATTSEQAKLLREEFERRGKIKTALVLHTEEEEESNSDVQKDFRGKISKDKKFESKYDIVIVYDMLLTGFDAKRLKRLYLLRYKRDHSLLQMLSRVNRPYKDLNYGYIVDFVDITDEFENTNQRYLDELRGELLDAEEAFKAIIRTPEEINKKKEELDDALFNYMGVIETNLEEFKDMLIPLEEDELRQVKKNLAEYKELYNELRISHEDVSSIDIDRIDSAFKETSRRLQIKIAMNGLDGDDDDFDPDVFENLIVDFLQYGEYDIEFTTDIEIMERISKITNAFSANNDKEDMQYSILQKEYKDIIRSFILVSEKPKMSKILENLDVLIGKVKKLNNENDALTTRYRGDDSAMRIHKRLMDAYQTSLTNSKVFKIVSHVLKHIDDNVGRIQNPSQSYVAKELRRPVNEAFTSLGLPRLSRDNTERIISLFIKGRYRND